MTQHSVLDGDVISYDTHEAVHRAFLVSIPIGLCREFLTVCLFVVALAMTAKLVAMILAEQEPRMAETLKGLVPAWRAILLFSLKYMLALGVLDLVMILSTTSAMSSYRLLEIAASKAFIYPVSLAWEAGIAWLLMPSAIQLLRVPNIATVSIECRKRGTVFAVLASATALALENLVGLAEARVSFDNQWELIAVSALNSIVVNASEVLLFISLALLAAECPRDIEGHNSIALSQE